MGVVRVSVNVCHAVLGEGVWLSESRVSEH